MLLKNKVSGLFLSGRWWQSWQQLKHKTVGVLLRLPSVFLLVELQRREICFFFWRELSARVLPVGKKILFPCLATHLSDVNQLLRRSNSEVMCFFTEQVLLDQNVQTPPPSPFSIQAFSKGTSCSNGQGFDYGLGNNKGMFLHSRFT